MVAVIHSSKSLRNALHYNENKVRQNVAGFIHAGNYSKDVCLLGFSDKINRLERLTALNQQTKINSVHISLNFDVSDKMNEEKLKDISDRYLKEIGFDQQPYLVYEHHDSGHPHIHIVTTNIKSDGSRISLHNLGRNQSEKARKKIETEFGLIKAQQNHSLNYKLKPVNVQKVQYGKSEIKRAITNVLDHVLPVYKYASLAELNAVLQQYNIIADRGSESSRTYKVKGLVYRILDADKRKVGVPIKASLIYNKPTLKNIEANFEHNEKERQKYKQRVMNAINFAILKKPYQSLEDLKTAVQKEKIQVVLRQNNNGVIYGITYVDHQTKCVFNGSDLGKQFSAKAIQERCGLIQGVHQKPDESPASTQHEESGAITANRKQSSSFSNINNHSTNAVPFMQTAVKLFNDLIEPEGNQNATEPSEQKKFKRKRKRKQQQSNN